ncbi:MAG: hypothetical protein JZU50_05695, partial [Desulfobulbaceae bacterium]|nr:hypothetical protein [Desulfobulbaceae bacterium]
MATTSSPRDLCGTIGSRIGIIRRKYRVAPGLYAVESSDPESAVLVTANYKLTIDILRFQLGGGDVWLPVLDPRGINAWCAAGVSARDVKRGSGFQVFFGPVRAADLPTYLQKGLQCDETMREVNFTLSERAVLIPVELFLLAKPLLATLVLVFLLTDIGPSLFSLSTALNRGLILLGATLLGIASEVVLISLLLPWLPCRQFWAKGALSGLACLLLGPGPSLPEQLAMALWAITVSSYLATNFTGSTPFTSLSGVEYEMRRGIPVQIATTCLTFGFRTGSVFSNTEGRMHGYRYIAGTAT